MKALLALATLAAMAVAAAAPAQAAPAPAAVDAAARELPRERWQRAVTHARRLHDAVRDQIAHMDYADDMPPATGFAGSPARRRRVERQAALRRAVTPAAAASVSVVPVSDDLRDAPNAAALEAPKAIALKGSPSLRSGAKPAPPALPGGVEPLPTLDQAMDPLMQADLPAAGSVPSACAPVRAGAKRALRAGCVAPRGI